MMRLKKGAILNVIGIGKITNENLTDDLYTRIVEINKQYEKYFTKSKDNGSKHKDKRTPEE